jgi:site-specific recombinase XerD
MAGRLMIEDRRDCECCGEPRAQVSMDLNFVLLSRTVEGAPEQQYRVPLQEFGSPDHRLNRGFLQRSVEHANECHQEELRRAVAMTTGTRMADVVGVRLADLRPTQVEIRWVDLDGARSRTVHFGRAARTTEELGDLLRSRLHAGLC